VSNPEQTAGEEQGDSNSGFNEHLKENKAAEPMDSSHLDSRSSISQVIEQLPQPNRTSRYTSVGRNLFKFINGSILLFVLITLSQG